MELHNIRNTKLPNIKNLFIYYTLPIWYYFYITFFTFEQRINDFYKLPKLSKSIFKDTARNSITYVSILSYDPTVIQGINMQFEL